MKKMLSVLLIIVLLAALFAGCTPTPATPDPTPTPAQGTETPGPTEPEPIDPADLPVLRVAVMPFYLSTITYYIVENGLDIENGFRIDLQLYPMGAPQIEAMLANEWDVGMMATAGVFGIANAGMMPIAPILRSSGGTGAFIRPDHPAAQVTGAVPGMPNVLGDADTLRGAQVLVPIGSLNHLNVVKWFYAVGLTSADFTVIDMTNANSLQAFRAGEGDITAFSPPLTHQAYAEGWVNGASLDDLNVEFWDYLYANPRTFDDMKELIAKFVGISIDVQTRFMSDQNLAAYWSYRWLHHENAVDTNQEQMAGEWQVRPFVTRDQAQAITDVGASLREIAEFFVDIGNLEESALANFNDPNIMTMEILNIIFNR
ncbi:MAG: hypothetical protein FWC72_03875 [Oscillospiraceae bacterium]|nr:hypothetical protein [Oscillospiraceae bacterium]